MTNFKKVPINFIKEEFVDINNNIEEVKEEIKIDDNLKTNTNKVNKEKIINNFNKTSNSWFSKFIFNSRFFQFIITSIVMLLIFNYSYIVTNKIKTIYYNYKMEQIVSETGEKILNAEIKKLEYEKLNKIREIEKTFQKNKIELETNYKNIMEDSIMLNKRKIEEQINSGWEINLSTIENINKKYKDSFSEAILNNKKELLIYEDFSKKDIIPNKNLEDYSNLENWYDNEHSFNYNDITDIQNIDKKDEEKIKENVSNSQKNQIAKKFDIKIKEELKSWIQILDKAKYEDVLNYWISFPSYFSYSKNWVKMSRNYYDIHYWVDYITRPLININLPFFKWKEARVYRTLDDNIVGKIMVLVSKNERFEYLHLNQMYKKVGETVKEWEIFAQTWNTWIWTWPHLHFSYIKDWFYVSHDWWIDFNNKKTFLQLGLTDKEAEELVNQGKNDYINMEAVYWLYSQLENKKLSDIKEIKEIMRRYEAKNLFGLTDFLKDDFFKWRITDTAFNVAVKARKKVDEFHDYKKKVFAWFLRNNKSIAKNIVNFNILKLWKDFEIKEEDKSNNWGIVNTTFADYEQPFINKEVSKNVEGEKKEDVKQLYPSTSNTNTLKKEAKIKKQATEKDLTIIKNAKSKFNIGVCQWYISKVYGKYDNKIVSQYDVNYMQDYAVLNINKLAPMIYEVAKENKTIEKIKEYSWLNNLEITECDIVMIELGKWYQEHNFHLDNPANWIWIFSNLYKNYNRQFPEDIGKKILSDKQYKTQIMDSMNLSLWKIKYKTKKTWKFLADREKENMSDYMLKYLLWSYHWLIGNDIDKNFYASNNLFYSNLPLKDISATRSTAYRDGWFTVATKIYLNFVR